MVVRTTVVLAFFTILLASWILWVEPQLKTTSTLEWESRNVLNFSAQECIQMEFKSKEHSFRIQRVSDQSFSLEYPEPRIQANEAFVTKVLGRFGNLNRTGTLPLQCPPETTQQQFLERYQLLAPAITLSFSFQDGTIHQIAFGKNDQEYCYVQINHSKEIQILPVDLLHLATPSLENLRDSALIHLDPAALVAIEIQQSSSTIRLEKPNSKSFYDGWQQTVPYRLPVDSDTLFLLLDTLKNQTAQNYHLFSEMEAEFAQASLAITFWENHQGQVLSKKLLLCQKEQQLYAYAPNSAWVRSFQNDFFLQTIHLPAWKYIERDVFRFRKKIR
ncbi:MAG: DUF4340 domain-containing protein [Planctomycetota bacterium]